MSNECENNIFLSMGFVIIVIGIVVGLMVFAIGITLNDVFWSSPYFDACDNFVNNVEEIKLGECITYMEENPSATGQDIIDYYNVGQVKLPENALVNTIDP